MGSLHILHFSEIIKGCRNHDEKCYELLYKQYYGYVISICLRYVIDRKIAEEVTNDCFMKVFEKIDYYDINKPFKSWIRKIAVNSSIDALRKEKRLQHMSEEQIVDTGYEETFPNKIDYNFLISLLKSLPEMHRLVFNMHELEGYQHSEIAERIGIPENSSRTYLSRAKQKLKGQFKTIKELYNV